MKNKQKPKELVSAFDYVLSLLKPIPEDKMEEAVEICTEDTLYDLFDFMETNQCFPEAQATKLRCYLSIELYNYEYGENYTEENTEKYNKLLDALHIHLSE